MKTRPMGMQARRRTGNIAYHLFMAVLCLTMIYPFVWSLFSSFKGREQLYTDSPLNILPEPPTLENYDRLFEVLPFERFVINSVILSVAIPLCMIAVASFTAYALTRLQFKGRNLLFLAFVATMMIPSHVTLIPNYKTIVDLNLYNTYTALFLTNVFTASNAFNIFFFRQFFLNLLGLHSQNRTTEKDILPAGEFPVKARPHLQHTGDFPVDVYGPLSGGGNAGQQLEQGGFPRSIAAQKRHALPFVNV